MTPHDRLIATIKKRLPRLQDWEVADVVKDIEEAGLLAGEWVSVKERLPEPMTEVLVEVNGHRGSSWRNNHNLVAYITYGGAWLEERHGISPLDVTHWQPLPQPPQADTGHD